MNDEKPKPKITVIPAARQPEKWIAIYCRVSTAYESQEESLDIQTATLKQVVAYNPKWKLYHIYTNQDSGGNVFRPGFQKMIFDCYENRINIVLVKTISRFARNTVDLLETVSRLKSLGVEIIFHQENLRTSKNLTVMSKFHNYSFRNTFLIAMQKPDASLIAGFFAWKNDFDRNVKKVKRVVVQTVLPYNEADESGGAGFILFPRCRR